MNNVKKKLEILSKITVTHDKYIITLSPTDLEMCNHAGRTLAEELELGTTLLSPILQMIFQEEYNHEFPKHIGPDHIEAFLAQYRVRLREVVQ